MKRLLLVLSAVAVAIVIPGCHDRHSDDRAHTTTTTTEETSTRVAPTSTSTTVHSSY